MLSLLYYINIQQIFKLQKIGVLSFILRTIVHEKYSWPGYHKTFSRMSLLNKHTEGGCQGLQSRNEECVQTLIGLSSGNLLRT